MISTDNPHRVTQAFLDAEIKACPGLAKFYAMGQKLGKIVVIDENTEIDNAIINKNM